MKTGQLDWQLLEAITVFSVLLKKARVLMLYYLNSIVAFICENILDQSAGSSPFTHDLDPTFQNANCVVKPVPTPAL